MGCGVSGSARYLPAPVDEGGRRRGSSSSSTAIPSATELDDGSSVPAAAEATWAARSAGDGSNGAEGAAVEKKSSRASRDVARAKAWTREEVARLEIPQLCRWLEALGIDFTSAVRSEIARDVLWREIETHRPPALAAVKAPEYLDTWPLPETLRWLEYFGKCDESIADKAALVELILSRGEDLPAPAFLGESAEDAYLTQVQRNVAMLKTAATALLTELSREITEIEQQRSQRDIAKSQEWYPNGKVTEAFNGAAFVQNAGESAANSEGVSASNIPFLEVSFGENVDYSVFDASGWAWCVKKHGQGQGWVPAAVIQEVARAKEDYNEGGEDCTMTLRRGEEMEVMQRHYSGWTLCNGRKGLHNANVIPDEGWVPDNFLTDHPRNAATKQHRQILNGVYRLAEDAYNFEKLFYKLRTEGSDEPIPLSDLYQQVVSLIEEYQSICEVVQQVVLTQLQEQEAAAAAEQQLKQQRTHHRQPDMGVHGLPIWVVEGGKCYWKSRSQAGKSLPVFIEKVCSRRQKILVSFEADKSARKIVKFSEFNDMATCPLTDQKHRKKQKQKGVAEQTDAAAANELAEDLRGLLDDFGSIVSQSKAGSSRSRASSIISSSSSGTSYTSTSVSSRSSGPAVARHGAPPPPPPAIPTAGRPPGAPPPPLFDDSESDKSSWESDEDVDFSEQVGQDGARHEENELVEEVEARTKRPDKLVEDSDDETGAETKAGSDQSDAADPAHDDSGTSESVDKALDKPAGNIPMDADVSPLGPADAEARMDADAVSLGPADAAAAAQEASDATPARDMHLRQGEAHAPSGLEFAAQPRAQDGGMQGQPGTEGGELGNDEAEAGDGSDAPVGQLASRTQVAGGDASSAEGRDDSMAAAKVDGGAASKDEDPLVQAASTAGAKHDGRALAELEAQIEAEADAEAKARAEAEAAARARAEAEAEAQASAAAKEAEEAAAKAAKEAEEAAARAAQEAEEAAARAAEAAAASAATKVQSVYRGHLGRARAEKLKMQQVRRRQQEQRMRDQAADAVMILRVAVARNRARQVVADLRIERAELRATGVIQAGYRQYSGLRTAVGRLAAASCQKWIKHAEVMRMMWLASGCAEGMMPEEWLERELLKQEQSEAAVVMQAGARVWLARRAVKAYRRRLAALALQSVAKKFAAQNVLVDLIEEDKAEQQRLIDEAEAQGRREEWAIQTLHRVSRRFTARCLLLMRRSEEQAALRIQTSWRSCRCRHQYAAMKAELAEARTKAALQLQAASRKYLDQSLLMQQQRQDAVGCIVSCSRRYAAFATVEELQRLRDVEQRLASTRIQASWRGVAGRRRAETRRQEVAEMRRQALAAARIQGLCRMRAAKVELVVRKKRRAAVLVQKLWRGVVGRRRVRRMRAEAGTRVIDALCNGEELDDDVARDSVWLRRLTLALENKEQIETEEEQKRLEQRRHNELADLHSRHPVTAPEGESGDPPKVRSLRCAAGASLDRSLAASRSATTRTRLRTRAVLLCQVIGDSASTTIAENKDMVRALGVDEGLLARLAVGDAARDIMLVVRTAWAIAASNKQRRPDGVPPPLDVVRTSIVSIMRRVSAELSRAQGGGGPEEEFAHKKALADAESAVVAAAEKRAKQIRQAALDPLMEELQSAKTDGKAAFEAAQQIYATVKPEIDALKDKRKAEHEAALAAMKSQRQSQHAQVRALSNIAIETQIEKERLEALFTHGRHRPNVCAKLVQTIKDLQTQLRDMEVNGTANRKNQGILAHALRALEVRAAKAEAEAHREKIYCNEADLSEDFDFTLSAQVAKKRERREEQEEEFRIALETEVRDLKKQQSEELAAEVAQVGMALRGEAEVHAEEVARQASRLDKWRRRAADARPWLGALAPLARANAILTVSAKALATEDAITAPLVNAVVSRLEALRKDAQSEAQAESPREDGVDKLAMKLSEVRRNILGLKKIYPDVEIKRQPLAVAEPSTDQASGGAPVEGDAVSNGASDAVGGGGLAAVRKLMGSGNSGALKKPAGAQSSGTTSAVPRVNPPATSTSPDASTALDGALQSTETTPMPFQPPPPIANPKNLPGASPDLKPVPPPPPGKPGSDAQPRPKKSSALLNAATAGLASFGSSLADLNSAFGSGPVGAPPEPPSFLPLPAPMMGGPPGPPPSMPGASFSPPPGPPPTATPSATPKRSSASPSSPTSPKSPSPGKPVAAGAGAAAVRSRQRPSSAIGSRGGPPAAQGAQAAGARSDKVGAPMRNRPPSAGGTRKPTVANSSAPSVAAAPAQGTGARAVRGMQRSRSGTNQAWG